MIPQPQDESGRQEAERQKLPGADVQIDKTAPHRSNLLSGIAGLDRLDGVN